MSRSHPYRRTKALGINVREGRADGLTPPRYARETTVDLPVLMP